MPGASYFSLAGALAFPALGALAQARHRARLVHRARSHALTPRTPSLVIQAGPGFAIGSCTASRCSMPSMWMSLASQMWWAFCPSAKQRLAGWGVALRTCHTVHRRTVGRSHCSPSARLMRTTAWTGEPPHCLPQPALLHGSHACSRLPLPPRPAPRARVQPSAVSLLHVHEGPRVRRHPHARGRRD